MQICRFCPFLALPRGSPITARGLRLLLYQGWGSRRLWGSWSTRGWWGEGAQSCSADHSRSSPARNTGLVLLAMLEPLHAELTLLPLQGSCCRGAALLCN